MSASEPLWRPLIASIVDPEQLLQWGKPALCWHAVQHCIFVHKN